jgi:hypothetical protein
MGASCGRIAVTVLRVLGSNLAIPRPMRPCARPGFDRRPELRPVGRGDAEPDRRAGGAEGWTRGEDHRDHGGLALLTELIFEGVGHMALHTSECTLLLPVLPRFGWCRPGSGGGAFVGARLQGAHHRGHGRGGGGPHPGGARGRREWIRDEAAGRRAAHNGDPRQRAGDLDGQCHAAKRGYKGQNGASYLPAGRGELAPQFIELTRSQE